MRTHPPVRCGIVAVQVPAGAPLDGVEPIRPWCVALLAGARFPVAQPFAGGLEAHTWTLATGLRARGTRIELHAPAGSDPALAPRAHEVMPALTPASRADVSSSPEAVMAEHHAQLGALLSLTDRAGAVDVVHNNSAHHLPVALAATLPVPMLTTLHTPPTAWLESAVRLRGRRAIGSFVAVSHHTARTWAPLLGPVPVIHNGIDLTAWRPGAGGDVVAWTGRIVPEKAPHLAIDAARRAGLPLQLAGPRHDRAYWRAEVEPRLGRGVEWVGHLDDAGLVELLGGAAACLVTPAWDEPFGLVALEAMACGTPVAAVHRGGLGEVVGATGGCLSPPDDPGALAAGLRAAVTLDRRGVRARAEAVGCAGRMTDAYLAAYRALVPVAASV